MAAFRQARRLPPATSGLQPPVAVGLRILESPEPWALTAAASEDGRSQIRGPARAAPPGLRGGGRRRCRGEQGQGRVRPRRAAAVPGSGDAGRVRGAQRVPVVPQRGARRHVLRGHRGVAPPAPGLLLRPALRRRERPEVMPPPPKLRLRDPDLTFGVAGLWLIPSGSEILR